MVNKIFKWRISLILILVVIGGCRVMITNFEEDEITVSINPKINSFSIVDSFNQTTSDPDTQLQINAGVLGGEFGVSYDINEEAYYISLGLNDTNVSNGSVIFYNNTCGNSRCIANITCRFTNSVAMSCGVIGLGNPEVDVSSIVTAIPMDAYLIIRACNSENSMCSESYQSVDLQ